MAKINPKKLAESLSAANPDELYNRRELMLAELSYVEEEIQRRATQRAHSCQGRRPALAG